MLLLLHMRHKLLKAKENSVENGFTGISFREMWALVVFSKVSFFWLTNCVFTCKHCLLLIWTNTKPSFLLRKYDPWHTVLFPDLPYSLFFFSSCAHAKSKQKGTRENGSANGVIEAAACCLIMRPNLKQTLYITLDEEIWTMLH